MLNPPNSLSLLRAPLAFLFIIDNVVLRITVIILAILSDCIDGYLARKYLYTSRLGAILDPLMDKFFVYVALSVLLYEHKIAVWAAPMMLSRDFFLLLFAFYIIAKGLWKTFEFKAVRWGKIATATQFGILIALVSNIYFPPYLYFSFVLFGILAFSELLDFAKRIASIAKKPSSR